MGKKHSKLGKKAIKDLCQTTNMTEKDLKDLYQAFLKDFPDGKLNMDQFKAMYQKFFPEGDAGYFAEQMFSTFDNDRDGYVDFREFMVGLSISKAGSIREKLEWAFSMYDLDKNGQISRDEMLQVVIAIYKMVGNSLELPEDESTPEKRVTKIFSSMDHDEDGFITLEEFLESATNDKSIRALFQCN